MKLSQLKPNPKNPRTIKDERFKKLVKSLREFPEMMAKRPMVCVTDVDGKLFPLGGNMRLKALQEIGMKEIPDEWVTLADDWTEEKRQEFVIKDNVGFGEWDWNELQSDWDLEQLEDWGLEVPGFDLNADELGEHFSLPDGDKSPFQKMTFILADEQAEQIKNAIDDIKKTEEYKYAETMGNENSNGNALYLIIMQWAEQRK
jgi:ParB-like chromosome segregation protein Spo0J